jgi:twitching motility protein PilT
MDDPRDFIEQLLRFAVASHASDLHLADGKRLRLRVDGVLRLINLPSLIDGDVEGCLDALMNDAQREQWKAFRRCELMHTIAKLARFRIRMFTQHQGAGAAIRVLPNEVPRLDTFGPPNGFSAVSSGAGIVFVTGPAGCGRTTVLASMLLAIGSLGPNRMVSIGRPLEFDLSDRLRDLTQVDLTHTAGGYSAAIRTASAAGAKVIAVDDASDRATMIEALRAAKLGCLVLCGLRVANTRYAIYEIIRRCPEGEEIARQLLADTFRAAFAQRWISTVGGGRTLAFEVLLGTGGVRNLLRTITTSSPLYSLIQTHMHRGFQTFDQDVHRLLREGRISFSEAASQSVNPEAIGGRAGDTGLYPAEDCGVVAASHGMFAPEALEDPEVFERVARCREGLVVVSGPPASGRTATAAYLLSLMMAKWQRHLVTLECPGEQAFEAGMDSTGHVTRHEARAGEVDLTDAVSAALGEDTDVLFVAVEPDAAALLSLMDAANAGLLVVIALPARSAAGAIEYLRSRMPAGEWPDRFENRRLMIRAVFAQRLVPRVGGGRVAAYEIKLDRQTGMQTLAQHLSRLAEAGTISPDDAELNESPEPSNSLDTALHL